MDRMQVFSSHELSRIHDASMQILEKTGINFNEETAAGIFRQHGVKTEGTKVFLNEAQVMSALKSVPKSFLLHARNPAFTAPIGGDDFVLTPTGGAPNVTDPDGRMRQGTLADFETCCKLVQTSSQLDIGGYLMVQPNDVPAETSHLDMMRAYLTLCDKPMLGPSFSGRCARDGLEIAGFFFGGKEALRDKPVMLTIVNAASPLMYSREQTEVILTLAEYGQPFVITNMILAGASGPVHLPTLIALQNAEILAGVVLSQLVRPGAPVVYGSTSAPMDMKTMVSAVGAPETVQIANANIQLARHYGLPSRCGGGLTDAHFPDGQAMAEGALMLSTVLRNGVNVVYHACGQMGSYISMSFEKWLMDEEVCHTVRRLLTPLDFSEIDTDLVDTIGIGGQYLTHPKTFAQFRSLSQPLLFNRSDQSKWTKAGAMRIDQAATAKLEKRLAAYEKPPIDPGAEKDLNRFVDTLKG